MLKDVSAGQMLADTQQLNIARLDADDMFLSLSLSLIRHIYVLIILVLCFCLNSYSFNNLEFFEKEFVQKCQRAS